MNNDAGILNPKLSSPGIMVYTLAMAKLSKIAKMVKMTKMSKMVKMVKMVKMSKTLVPAILLIGIVILLSACGSPIDDSGDPGTIGTITSVDIAENGGDRLATILVEGTPEENAGLTSDKASVGLTKDTVLVNGEDKKYLEAEDLQLLTVGTNIEIVFTGPVAESYPVQGGAKVIRLR